MYYVSKFTKPVYKAGEVAKVLGITTQTLRVYEDDGKIAYFRSEGGHRLVKREDLLFFYKFEKTDGCCRQGNGRLLFYGVFYGVGCKSRIA